MVENCFKYDWKDGDWKDYGWQSACINCQVDFGDQKLTKHPFIICMANLHTFGRLFVVHVGKYTSPIDATPMGHVDLWANNFDETSQLPVFFRITFKRMDDVHHHFFWGPFYGVVGKQHFQRKMDMDI